MHFVESADQGGERRRRCVLEDDMDGIGGIADGKHHGSTFGRLAAQLLSDPLIGRGHKDARPPGGGQTACTTLVFTE
jgi:hypothetical protein